MRIIFKIVFLVLFQIVKCQNDFRVAVEGPVILPNNEVAYFCDILDTRPNVHFDYKVQFLFDFVLQGKSFIETENNGRVKLEENFVIGKMGKQLKCQATAFSSSGNDLTTTSENFIIIGIMEEFKRSKRDSEKNLLCKSCVSENDKDPLFIQYRTTSPFRCGDNLNVTGCSITADVTTSGDLVVKQEDEMINPCKIKFTDEGFRGNYKSNISVYAVRDDISRVGGRPNSVYAVHHL